MRLVTFELDGPPRIGVVANDEVIDLSHPDWNMPAGMIDLISRWSEYATKVATIVQSVGTRIPLASVHLLAPVPRPGKVLAIGLNYAAHIAEAGQKNPQYQTWFSKHVTAVNGPYDPVDLPRASIQLDYEAELVAVIGRRGRHIPKGRALDYVFGYCVGNDVSVRDWQMNTSQWMLGKSFDTHAPFGPWITTADEIDPRALGIRGFVNGELRQNSNTKQMLFDCEAQIEHLSQAMTLEPGDLIFTGTPSGVGMGRNPPLYLKAGDVVRVEID